MAQAGAERQVQDQQQQVADEQAGDQRPDQVALALQQQRAGLDAVRDQGGEHDRRGRVGRQAERQHRHHGAGGAGVVGRLRTGDALDGSLAELLGVLGQPLLGDVGEEGRDLRAAGRDDAEREAERGAAQPGLPGPLPVLLAQERATDRDDLGGLAAQVGGHPEGLAEGEDADRDHDDVDAVAELGMPKVSRACPLTASMPIMPIVRPSTRAMKPRNRDAPSTAVTATKASSMIARYSGAPSETANFAISGAKNTSRVVPMVPATKEPMAAVARACAALPALAIRLPSMAVTTEDDSPGVLSRIEVVDPPYMPP